MEEAGSSAGWAAVGRMKAQGVPSDQIAAEVASWRASGWEPRSEFTGCMLDAFAARSAGAPESVVSDLVEPWRARYGSGAIAEAFVRMSSAANRIASRRGPSDG